MTPERHRQIAGLYHEALQLGAEERAAFLGRECAGDPALRCDVESLVEAHEQAGDFIGAPALRVAARLLAGDESDALTGRTFGRYKVLSPLGAGGMGRVYLAEDGELGRRVALKFLPEYFAHDADRVGRLRREACAASALNHPNIVTVHEVGECGPVCYIVTEFIEGTTLRHHAAGARLKLGEVLDIAIQVAGALACAHQEGIVHRDVKPENIMVRSDGIVKVLDFGLAKLTRLPAASADAGAARRATADTDPGVVMGTAAYMSPEQVRALDLDPRTDIWSLGVVLYELVAGRAPFEGPTTGDVIAAIIDREPQPLARFSPGVLHELERIVTKALTKDREERYQVVKDLLIDLKALRRELEFEAELDRTVAPELRDALGAASRGSGRTSAAGTRDAAAARPTSSAEYLVNEFKRHKKGVGLFAAALALAVAAALLPVYFRRAPALTERDTILLADFANTTGDPVFDGTLKQALAVQLGQSPFLNTYSDERVREALRFMGRSPDERVTKEVAREICQRQGLKALLAGSISGLGSHYVITLEAVNAQTGDSLAGEQVEAESKEQVLKKLGEAASTLRGRLGESLGSIQKFDAPIEQATTSSLEALKAFALGDEQRAGGAYLEAVPFYKRATELDPNFALAYARLAVMYTNTYQSELATQYAEKAFELRERVSERERFYIESRYHGEIGDLDRTIEVLGLWKRTYPRDFVPYNNLTLNHCQIGQYEQALVEGREAIRLNPNVTAPYSVTGLAYIGLGRFDEAKAVVEQAHAQKLDSVSLHAQLYAIAFIRGDAAAMQQQVEWAKGKPNGYEIVTQQAGAAAHLGRLREAGDLLNHAIDLALRNNVESAASNAALTALRGAAVGDCRHVKAGTARALAIKRTRNSLSQSALALVLCGEAGQAQPLVDELAKRFPKDTFVNVIWLPTIRAAIELNRNNPAQALQLLRPAGRFERSLVGRWPVYFRGLAYLRQRAGAQATAEFRKLLEHKAGVIYHSFGPSTSVQPLAHLGLARAAALDGDTAASRQAYQDFFALWKDADPDIPVLREARREYERLE